MRSWSERNEQAQKEYEAQMSERNQAEPATFKISKTIKFTSMFGWVTKLFKKKSKLP